MLTLTYAVIGFYFFGQVTTFSGFGGMTGIDAPAFFLDQPKRLYYAALVLSVLAYAGVPCDRPHSVRHGAAGRP